MSLRFAFGQCEIDVKPPVVLAGYSPLRASIGVHDSLYARCAAIDDGQKRLLLVTLDVIAVDDALCRAIETALCRAGIRFDELSVFAAHTHSGPGGLTDTAHGALRGFAGVFGEADAGMVNAVCRAVVAAASVASNPGECTLRVFETEVDTVGANRTDRGLPGDHKLTGFEFEREKNRWLIWNYSCHPTVLSGNNTLISADLPGETARLLGDRYEGVMFINGSCGDISTRFNRQGEGFPELTRFAGLLAGAIIDGSQHSAAADDGLSFRRVPVVLKAKKALTREQATTQVRECQKKLEETIAAGGNVTEVRVVRSYLEGANAALTYAINSEGADNFTLDCRIIRFGGYTLVCVPGELFSELSNPVKSTRDRVLFAGYANGYYLYISDEKGYDAGLYEAQSSPFRRGEGEKLIATLEKEL